ncbi:energy transducer TonB [Photobacterium sp. DNB23_23_1]|uniref:Energy transducer TonB n=1 Tax=Photobacterium pectinilyticum TaxID=2906793 RepID=A0ABT1N5G8_9GAMM|nr:energy transducer TonB [Photobacterium sp. ZSDE20]MCQ1058479.1 energy transducer TonB [Photobacterium sp. ZSDE20]MDD1823202.1 energy transducer TonB [Photobacterium sp. ZSDE20]
MNAKRYAIAGIASVLAHSLLLSAIPNRMVMAMPVGTESTKVSLNLVSAPSPQPSEPDAAEAPPPAPVEAPKKVVKEETTVKKLVKKKQPEPKAEIKKTSKPTPKKPVEKVVEPKKVKKPVDVKKTETTEEITKAPDAAPAVKSQAASGVNSEPQLVTTPTFATRPSPVKYPRIAKRRGLEGQVLVEIWIDESGKQVKQNLVKSSGTEILDDAAIAAIKRWRFSSHIVDGQAIAHRVQVPVRFKLD